MAGFFDGLLDSIQNPLFLGGVGMMSDGAQGMMQGMQAGGQFAQQKRKRAQEEAMQNGLMAMQNLTQEDKQVLGASPELAADVLGKMYANKFDPNAGLDRRLKEAQINKYNKEAAGGASAKYGKTGAIMQGPDGKYYSVQFAEDGTKKIEPLATGETALSPARGVDIVGDTMYDKQTGQTVRNVGSSIASGETAKVIGKDTGDGRMALPKMQRSLQQYEIKSANVDKFIDEAIQQAQGTGAAGFVGGLSRQVWGSPGYNLVQKIKPIVGNLGFDELQTMRDNSPTGGALGAIAVQELDMLQSTLGSLDTAQDPAQLTQHLNRLKEIKAQFRELKRQAYEQDVARFGAANVPNPNGGGTQQAPQSSGGVTHRWNPQTGHVEAVEGR